jgi:hypothetical protein
VKTKVDTGSTPGGGKDVLFVYIKRVVDIRISGL